MSGFSRHVYNSYKKLLSNKCYYVIGSDCDINIIELLRNEHSKPVPMLRVEIKNLYKAIYNSKVSSQSLSRSEIVAMSAMIDGVGCLESIVDDITVKHIEARIK